MPRYSIGLDFGTNSVRCLAVRLDDGEEVGTAVAPYPSGEDGILLDRNEPELARQNPADYLIAAEEAIRKGVATAREGDAEFREEDVVGIGVDTTASTPLPVDAEGKPLAMRPEFASRLSAMAWLWKDHTGHEEAAQITEAASKKRPRYLAKCGGAYSSEWFWSKILRCLRTDPEVFHAAHTWIECADWIPAALTGTEKTPKRGICAAGHKGLFHSDWGGYPDGEFLSGIEPGLPEMRERLPNTAETVSKIAGSLTSEWAAKTGLPEGTPVAVGAIDAHLGAVGSGIKQGTLVQILGTSACDMAVWPLEEDLPDIPGISGIVPESILPGMYGLEAGQAAVGDLFNWFVGPMNAGTHEELTRKAEALRPGQSGLLALDWNNGNRSVLTDPRLTGLLIGQTLRTEPHEVYRALIEAAAFGCLAIMWRLEEYGVEIREVVNCGGIAEKNPMVMQIYADVCGRPMKLSRSSEACALGAAICGAVASGAFPDFPSAQARLAGVKEKEFRPQAEAHKVYKQLFELYMGLHGAFGVPKAQTDLFPIMKSLLIIRDAALGKGSFR